MGSFWSRGSPDVAGTHSPPTDGQVVTTVSRNVGSSPRAPSWKKFPEQGTDCDLEGELENVETPVADRTE